MLSKDELLADIGSIIRKKRLMTDLNGKQLADKANINRDYYRDVERGKRNISLLSLQKIAVALNISVRDLLDKDYIIKKGR